MKILNEIKRFDYFISPPTELHTRSAPVKAKLASALNEQNVRTTSLGYGESYSVCFKTAIARQINAKYSITSVSML